LPLGLTLLAASFAAAGGRQDKFVGYYDDGQPMYRAEVKSEKFTKGFETQKKTQWCWAACLSSVFKFYGHPVSQERIVKQLYGSDVNLPMYIAKQFARLLNRTWTDDNGVQFKATLKAVYDSRAHVSTITNAFILDELRQGRPIIHCNLHHCMVATAVDYTPSGVVGVWAYDPMPGAVRMPLLTGNQIKMAESGGEVIFLAAVEVSEVDQPGLVRPG